MGDPTIRTIPKVRTYVSARKAGTKGKGSTVNLTVDNATPTDVVRFINDGMSKQREQHAAAEQR